MPEKVLRGEDRQTLERVAAALTDALQEFHRGIEMQH